MQSERPPTPTRAQTAQQGAPHKNTRRESREMVLRMLFAIDIGHQPADEAITASLEQSVLEGANRTFADEVARGTVSHQAAIDERLRALTQEWTLERQAAVDRNILRMTAYEILYRPETPVAAVINEAVELAKKYSTAESGRFVNGVLGALARAPRGAEPPAAAADAASAGARKYRTLHAGDYGAQRAERSAGTAAAAIAVDTPPDTLPADGRGAAGAEYDGPDLGHDDPDEQMQGSAIGERMAHAHDHDDQATPQEPPSGAEPAI